MAEAHVVEVQTVVVVTYGERMEVDCMWPTGAPYYNSPISARGEEQAQELARTIATKVERISHVISSPYLCCLQTSKIIADVLHLPTVGLNSDFSEYVDSSLQFHSEPRFPSPFASTVIAIDKSGINNPLPPFPEPKENVYDRFDRGINQTADKNWPRNLVLVAHPLGVYRALYQGWQYETAFPQSVNVNYCGFVTLQREGRSQWKIIDRSGIRW